MFRETRIRFIEFEARFASREVLTHWVFASNERLLADLGIGIHHDWYVHFTGMFPQCLRFQIANPSNIFILRVADKSIQASFSTAIPSFVSHLTTMNDPDSAMPPPDHRARSFSFADQSESSLSSFASKKRRQCANTHFVQQESKEADLSMGSPGSLRSITSAASTSDDTASGHWNSSPDNHIMTLSVVSPFVARAMSRYARHENDMMVYLEGPSMYACSECGTHLTSHDDIISKSFHGRHGRAFLLETCVNVKVGPAEDRRLLTGLHTVCDLYCRRCNTLVGWTYKRAYEESQKYKEGKFIIEKVYLSMMEDRKPFQGKTPRFGDNSWSQRSFNRGMKTTNTNSIRPSLYSSPIG